MHVLLVHCSIWQRASWLNEVQNVPSSSLWAVAWPWKLAGDLSTTRRRKSRRWPLRPLPDLCPPQRPDRRCRGRPLRRMERRQVPLRHRRQARRIRGSQEGRRLLPCLRNRKSRMHTSSGWNERRPILRRSGGFGGWVFRWFRDAARAHALCAGHLPASTNRCKRVKRGERMGRSVPPRPAHLPPPRDRIVGSDISDQMLATVLVKKSGGSCLPGIPV